MRMVPGRAFSLRGNANRLLGIPVTKEYGTANGRRFILEQLRYEQIRDELKRLPAPGSGTNSPAGASLKKPTRWLASAATGTPASRRWSNWSAGVQPASAKPKSSAMSPSPANRRSLRLFFRLATWPPPHQPASRPVGTVTHVAALAQPNAFVLDWNLVDADGSLQDFVFACPAAATYLLRGEVHLPGTTTFTPGAILKYCPGAALLP